MMKYKAVIFDLDGTLLNTLGDLHAAVNYALKKNGMPERTIGDVRRFVGNGVAKLIYRSVPEGADPATVLKDFRGYYGSHCRDLTAPYDGVCNLLTELEKRGIMTAVVSNKLESAVKVLCREYFGDGFAAVVGDVDDRARKPSPDPVMKAVADMGISADETVYVGDSEVDVLTAHNCNMDCIAVTWGFRDKNTLFEAGAKVFADTPEELLIKILA